MISARGGSGSKRETIRTGLVLAARPKSASQTSPGLGFIQYVEDFLFAFARAHYVESIRVSPHDNVVYQALDVCSFCGIPVLETLVQFLGHRRHARNIVFRPFESQ